MRIAVFQTPPTVGQSLISPANDYPNAVFIHKIGHPAISSGRKIQNYHGIAGYPLTKIPVFPGSFRRHPSPGRLELLIFNRYN